MIRPGKNVLTTGEVAKICNVAPRTVSKWFDSGQLRGYRIPGSKDRRIPLEHLIRFMRVHGIPLNGLDTGRKRVLLLDGDVRLRESVEHGLAESGYEVAIATSAIEAGSLANEITPHALIVDVTLPDVVPKSIARWVRSTGALQGSGLIAIAADLRESRGQALLQDGFDGYLSKPFEIRSLIQLIEETTSVVA